MEILKISFEADVAHWRTDKIADFINKFSKVFQEQQFETKEMTGAKKKTTDANHEIAYGVTHSFLGAECTKCGSKNVKKISERKNNMFKTRYYKCEDCRHNFKTNEFAPPKNEKLPE